MNKEPGSNSKAPLFLAAVVVVLILLLVGAATLFALRGCGTPTPTPRPSITWPPVVLTATPTRKPIPSPSATTAPTLTPTPLPTPTPTPTPIVVPLESLKRERLVTFEYKVQTIAEVTHEPGSWWEKVFGPERIVLIGVVRVQAGVDLAGMTDKDVIVQGQKVTIYLPNAEIFSTELLEKESSVYAHDEKLLFSNISDQQIELEAAAKAEQQAEEWATENRILDYAQESAGNRMEVFLRRLGFTDVAVKFRERQ